MEKMEKDNAAAEQRRFGENKRRLIDRKKTEKVLHNWKEFNLAMIQMTT
jgi:hypothetical protein